MIKQSKGFTLVELLIVVAIIGIIAAIAVPNLLSAILRAKISRTMADMRAINTALGTYLVDQGYYPINDHATIPSTETMLTAALLPAKYYQGGLTDGWGRSFFYRTTATGSDYLLTSGGNDSNFSNRCNQDHWNDPIGFEWPGCHPAYRVDGFDLKMMKEIGCDVFSVNGVFPVDE